MQGRHGTVWVLLVDAFSGWLASLKVMMGCPLCLECVLKLNLFGKRSDIYLTLWRVLQLIISQRLV